MKVLLAGSNGEGTLACLVVDRHVVDGNAILRCALEHSLEDNEYRIFFPQEAAQSLKRWLLAKSAPSELTPLFWLASVLQVHLPLLSRYAHGGVPCSGETEYGVH